MGRDEQWAQGHLQLQPPQPTRAPEVLAQTARHRLGHASAVITLRRRLLRDAKDLANLGQEPFAATHGNLYAVRSWSALVEPEQKFPESAEMRELATAKG